MTYTFFSFSIAAFIELNTNIFETNIVNISLLLGLLIYGYQTSFRDTLKDRQVAISQVIENALTDSLVAARYYKSVQEGCKQCLFCLESWKKMYEKEKIEIVTNKYKQVKSGVVEIFDTTETFIENFETKSFLSLQRYILFLTSSRILRQFLRLPATKQSSFIKKTLETLGGQN
jgi:F0F1-type ATP synthase membrane subunit b/b'